MGAHAVLSASAAERWMACPASIRLSAGIPDPGSKYAEEGTAAHFLAEQCLRGEVIAAQALDKFIGYMQGSKELALLPPELCVSGKPVTEEMVEAVEMYAQTIAQDRLEMPGAVLKIEERFHLDWLYEGLFGTNDASLVEPFGRLVVYDFKYGAGHAVEVRDNPQLLYYALGAAHGSDHDEVELVIVQPRARHKDGPVRRDRLAVADLMAWGRDKLLPAAQATEAPDAPARAGKHCRFCRAMPVCPALKEKALATCKAVFAPEQKAITLPPPELLNTQELVEVLGFAEMLAAYAKRVEAHAQTLLERGERLPGYKLVAKRTNRAWRSEQEVVGRLLHLYRMDIYNQKIKSPTQMEELIKAKGGDPRELLEGLIVKPDGGVVIAPEWDRRKEVPPPALPATAQFHEDGAFLDPIFA
jgi:hypothetical protein